jgi:hypothetical protein
VDARPVVGETPAYTAPVTALVRAVVAVTRTKRRRYLWCAWWRDAPCADPFRPPDAWKGGAHSQEEAMDDAQAVAGMSLSPIESRWAGAWLRVRDGLPPFPERAPRVLSIGPKPIDPHAILGVPIDAPIEELRNQFRAKALLLHPDHGGDVSAFIALKRAYDTLSARRRRGR